MNGLDSSSLLLPPMRPHPVTRMTLHSVRGEYLSKKYLEMNHQQSPTFLNSPGVNKKPSFSGQTVSEVLNQIDLLDIFGNFDL